MKQICPSCDERLKRGAHTCYECGWKFAFQGGQDMSDMAWCQLVDELSDQERLYFTTNQLFIHWQRPRVARLNASIAQMYLAFPLLIVGSLTPLSLHLILISSISLVALIPGVSQLLAPIVGWRIFRPLMRLLVWSAALSSPWWLNLSLSLTPPLLLFIIAGIDIIRRRRLLSKETFMSQLQRWRRLHELPMLITEPQLQRPQPEIQGEALYDYEVRQVLVVDQDLTVDLLTRNHFLTHHHLLLLSLNGYPEYTAAFTRRLLTLEEDVTLYLLHRDGHEVSEVLQKVRALGFRAHRLVHLGWGAKSRPLLIDHLGFIPKEWDAFAVDSLPPESLLEGLPIAIEDETPLVNVLGRRLRVLS